MALIVTIISAYAQEPVDFCKNQPSGATIENPYNCATFYLCEGGKAYLFWCPGALLYHGERNRCEYADIVDCGSRPTFTTPSTTTTTMVPTSVPGVTEK